MSTPLRIAVIQGPTREGRLGPTVANRPVRHVADRPDMTVDLIDLAETPLPTVFPHLGQAPTDEAEPHAVTIRDSVGLTGIWGQFDAEGQAVDPGADAAAKTMLGQLAWWAEALRAARATTPYTV